MENLANELLGYEIHRSSSEDGDYEFCDYVNDTAFIDGDVEIGKTYYYRICAYNKW